MRHTPKNATATQPVPARCQRRRGPNIRGRARDSNLLALNSTSGSTGRHYPRRDAGPMRGDAENNPATPLPTSRLPAAPRGCPSVRFAAVDQQLDERPHRRVPQNSPTRPKSGARGRGAARHGGRDRGRPGARGGGVELIRNGRKEFGCDLEVEGLTPRCLDARRLGSHPVERVATRGEERMCMSCGCGEPHETHGDKRNIVYEDLKKAADASKIPVKEAVQNIEKTLRAEKPRSLVADDR